VVEEASMSEHPNLPLEHLVYSESAILELLGTNKKVLDELGREKGFPFVRLTAGDRVYLAKDVLEWLERQGKL
jgi:hypothetical protein